MTKKKKPIDLCSLADGEQILEIAYYGPGDHKYLKEEMGRYWFEKEILLPFMGQYSKDKTIAVIDYDWCGDTMQHFGLGDTPEEAVKSALTTLIAKHKPLTDAAEKALKGIESCS